MAYSGYVLMKIVLAVGGAILFGIVDFVAILLLFIPLGILGVAAYFVARAAALSWNAVTISAVVLLSVAAIGGILWLISFLIFPRPGFLPVLYTAVFRLALSIARCRSPPGAASAT